MAKKKRAAEQVSTDNVSTYQIYGEEIGKIWNHQLFDSQREEIINVTEDDIWVEMALSSLLGKGSLGERIQTIRIFINSVSCKNGLISLGELNGYNILILQILEKKLCHVISHVSVKSQSGNAILLIAWIMGWKTFLFAVLLISFLPIFSINSRIVPSTFIPLVMVGPVVVAVSMKCNYVCSWYPLISVVPAVMTLLLSQTVNSGPAIRSVYKLGLASILFYNVFALVYVFFFVNKWHALLTGLVFNWPLFSGILGLLVFALIVLTGFLKDIVFAARNHLFWKSTASLLAIAAPASGYTTESTLWAWTMGFTTVLTILVAVPSPNKKIREKIDTVLCFLLDVMQYGIMIFQTATATVVIFHKSPKMGIKWIKYMFSKKDVSQNSEM